VAIERARAIAGDLNVSVTPGKIASQCLELGLLVEGSRVTHLRYQVRRS
jgi:hypothetical protein